MARSSGFAVRKQWGFTPIAIICFVLLYLPVILLVIYSFNAGTSVAIWEGFSLQWYRSAWANEQVQEATVRSLVLAFWASLVATALLILFAGIKVQTGYTGLGYLVLAHSAFCIPFAYLPIRARLQGMDLTLEQAASDLYATPYQIFRRITLPQLWPGILAGAMLAFVISLDDVVITEFVKSAGQDTLPTYMLGQLRRVVTPEVNAISTVLLTISITMVIAFFFLSRTKK